MVFFIFYPDLLIHFELFVFKDSSSYFFFFHEVIDLLNWLSRTHSLWQADTTQADLCPFVPARLQVLLLSKGIISSLWPILHFAFLALPPVEGGRSVLTCSSQGNSRLAPTYGFLLFSKSPFGEIHCDSMGPVERWITASQYISPGLVHALWP